MLFILTLLALIAFTAAQPILNPSFEGTPAGNCSMDNWIVIDPPGVPQNFQPSTSRPAGYPAAILTLTGNTIPSDGTCSFVTSWGVQTGETPGPISIDQTIPPAVVPAGGLATFTFDWRFAHILDVQDTTNRSATASLEDSMSATIGSVQYVFIDAADGGIVLPASTGSEAIGPFPTDGGLIRIYFLWTLEEEGNAVGLEVDNLALLVTFPTTTPPTTTAPTDTPVTTAPTTEAPSIVGDPHFIGFHNQKYDFHGFDNEIFNLISHPFYQFNALFSKTYVESEDEQTYITKAGLTVTGVDASSDELLIGCAYDKVNGYSLPTFTLNGVVVPVSFAKGSPLKIASSHYISIERNRTDAMIEIETPYFHTSLTFDQFHDTCFLNIERVSYNENSENLHASLVHGVLGQTVYFNGNMTSEGMQGEGIVEGFPTDYKIQSFDLYGSDFRFNRFLSN